ncbi:nuclear transport factor 2 family protein [Streptomyces sp. ME19-01-6]|uniref:nuclear transport factor 2 family protein n=1 Tax=Streptomyces sp. ME19-01-6 TaxID=3028686 RepID=UPI0029BF605F|nr:nuclear transport factor 2 family protein [Streptomyces sp. ME19-01-6]MDX3231894.1 nuclear transport factor 2 family protein [Streptomyces sp. ME19-01-6]
MTAQAPVVGQESDVDFLKARTACLDIVTTSLRLVDSGQATKALELFTDDGELVLGNTVISGDALRAALAQRETDGIRRLHLPGEPLFRLLTPDVAKTETVLQLFHLGTDGTSPRAVSRLTDRFVRDEQHVWRLSRRTTTILAGSA